MKAQSLSVVIPNKKCINQCKFCVSCMSPSAFKNQMDDNLPFFDLYLKDYLKRLEFASRNGCNTVMLTGNSEPQQNRKFLTYFGLFMQMMKNPFNWIEMQTTGVLLDQNYLRFLRNHVGVNLISLSISAPDDEVNNKIIDVPDGLGVELRHLAQEIKRYDFSLRLSVNLTSEFDTFKDRVENFFGWAKSLNADQITCRVLYSDGGDSVQSKWIAENAAKPETIQAIANYVMLYGKPLGVLPYGAIKYSLDGMSIVVDDDCMAKSKLPDEDKDAYKYLILQPDCKLYSQWDDPASLIF